MTAARPGPMFYYEERGMTGRWSPVLASAKPDTVTKNGQQRERRVTGIGRRIRAIRRVPDDMLGLTLTELHKALSTEADEVRDGAPAEGGAA